MAKNKEYTEKGVREFYSVKGCNSCSDCGNLLTKTDNTGKTVYICKKLIGKTSYLDRRFPYDNTKCKEFQEQSTEG